jgi:hypothetical protein
MRPPLVDPAVMAGLKVLGGSLSSRAGLVGRPSLIARMPNLSKLLVDSGCWRAVYPGRLERPPQPRSHV